MRTLQERIWMVKLFVVSGSVTHVQREWHKHFGTAPPDKNTVLSTNRKFDETGSVADATR